MLKGIYFNQIVKINAKNQIEKKQIHVLSKQTVYSGLKCRKG